MKDDAVWTAFAETGDPIYYLLYKAALDAAKKDGSGK